MRLAHLGGQENVFALDAGLAQPLAHFLFVAVEPRSVDVAVTHLQRVFDRVDAEIALERHGAEADLRDTAPVSLNDGGWRDWHEQLRLK